MKQFNKKQLKFTIISQQLGSIFTVAPRTSHKAVFYTSQNLHISQISVNEQ